MPSHQTLIAENPRRELTPCPARIPSCVKPEPDTEDVLMVDLLHVTPALESVWQSRQRVAWNHGAIGTVSRAGLVALKRLRGSGQDHDDIKRLTGETE